MLNALTTMAQPPVGGKGAALTSAVLTAETPNGRVSWALSGACAQHFTQTIRKSRAEFSWHLVALGLPGPHSPPLLA